MDHREELEETSRDFATDNSYAKESEEAGSNSTLSVERGSEVKKLRLWRILALCSIGLAQDLILSQEGGYSVPLMVDSGLPIQFTSFLWGIAAALILLLQPVNSISDNCTWSWRRRRVFIVLLSVTCILCLVFAPNMLYVVRPRLIATIVVFTCLVVLDTSVILLMSMARAYLMDVVPLSQNLLAGFTFQLMAGVGGMFGSILSGIPWSRDFGSTVTIQNQTQVVFSVVALVTIICLFSSIFGVKEIVAKPEEQVEDLHPSEPKGIKQHWCFRWIVEPYFDSIQFLYYMSVHMWLTFLYTITSATVLITYGAYFTVFVGTAVYGGAQSCPVDSECYQNYVAGVRVGCLGFALAGATNIVFSLSLNWITKYLKLKTVYLIALTVFTIATAAMSNFHQLPLVLILGMSFGLLYGLSMNIPFQMIPIYKNLDMLFCKQWPNQNDVVEGKAAAVIGTGVTLGNIVMTVVVLLVTSASEDINVLMLIP